MYEEEYSRKNQDDQIEDAEITEFTEESAGDVPEKTETEPEGAADELVRDMTEAAEEPEETAKTAEPENKEEKEAGKETVFSDRRTEYSQESGRSYADYRFENPHMPVEPEKKAKAPFWRKGLAAVALGLIFGGCVGAGLYASSLVTGAGRGAEAETRSVGFIGEEAVLPAVSDNLENSQEDKIVTTTVAAAPAPVREGRESGKDRAPAPEAPGNTMDVADVAEKVMPSVVAITSDYTALTRDFWGQTYQQQAEASGSGFIVGDNGEELLIATNQHVVSDADKLGVQFIDGSKAEARLKGQDEEADLAVIAVERDDLSKDTLDAISVAVLGDSDSLRVGETAIAIGNALGYGQSVTVGVVSALDRELKLDNGTHKLIQTDAAINPGNSGGALLDIHGHVIGINEAKLSSSGVEGMGYAIPISRAQPVIDQLMNQSTKERVAEKDRGYLGISGVDVTADVSEQYNMPRGVYVSRVGTGLAAEKAGIRKGDIITKFDGQTIQTMSQLQSLIEYYASGQKVKVTVQSPVEDGYGFEEKNLTVTLGGSMADQLLEESGQGRRGNRNEDMDDDDDYDDDDYDDNYDDDDDSDDSDDYDDDDDRYDDGYSMPQMDDLEDLFRYFGQMWR